MATTNILNAGSATQSTIEGDVVFGEGRITLLGDLLREGAVIVQNPSYAAHFGDRKDLMALTRADGEVVLEFSAIAPLPGGDGTQPLPRITKSEPEALRMRGIFFGTEEAHEPIAMSSLDLALDASGSVVAEPDEVRMQVHSGARTAEFELFVDRVETNVPLRLAVLEVAPAAPAEGWIYFDKSKKAVRVWSEGAWRDLMTA